MLGPEEFDTMLTLFNGGDSRPFDELISEFTSKIHPSDTYACCEAVATLLNDGKVNKPTQRLVGFAILHQAYSSQQPCYNPFKSFLVKAASDEEAQKFERSFLLELLGFTCSTIKAEVLKLFAADYIRNFDPSSHTFSLREQLQQQYFDELHAESYSRLIRNLVKNTLPNPDVPPGCDINSTEFDMQHGVLPKIGSGDRDETIKGLMQNLSLEGLDPLWTRPRPMRFPVLQEEDDGSCGKGTAVRNLIAKALKEPLEDAQLVELRKNNPAIEAKVVDALVKLANSPENVVYEPSGTSG